MLQQGQVFELATRGRDGKRLWAYRYRAGGRDAKRVQRGGFRSEAVARAGLERALEKLRRESGVGRRLTLAEFVDEYLAQHEVSPVTLEKLRFLLSRAVQTFGDYYLDELDPVEISAWRMTVPPGYRFDATQALRQVLARAVLWRMIDVNPAKLGVDNPTPRRREQRPFESWAELDAVAANLAPRYRPMVIFAAEGVALSANRRVRERSGMTPDGGARWVRVGSGVTHAGARVIRCGPVLRNVPRWLRRPMICAHLLSL